MKKYLIVLLVTITLVNCNSKTSSRYEDFYPHLNEYYSEKQLGACIDDDSTMFRLFAPRATKVALRIFENHYSSDQSEYIMEMDENGVWEYSLPGALYGTYYGYSIWGPEGRGEMFDSDIVLADPYSKAVVTLNNYHHEARTLIIDDDFDWDDDTWLKSPITDLIIYEMHVRDMTANPSSECTAAGTYAGFTESGITGGINHLLELGVNAVELLPIHDFANIELPYRDPHTFIENTWNPYERNHWGYMTSYFFAPESYYALGETLKRDDFCGESGNQVNELKLMIKKLHENNIAVILDVVYNHVSQYDYNPFKYIDKKYYFRLNQNADFLSHSGCGNDFMTERPMARRLIIDSIKYWMTEYHVDGFRFDLAYLLDKTTLNEILQEARKINPDVYIIAEPWGGGYDPAGFSNIGWAAWNDRFRNGVKGQNPYDNHGFIFGRLENNTNVDDLKNFFLGTLASRGGLFQSPTHSINYLESHDDHTLGDFIRIASGELNYSERILNMDEHVKLTPLQLKYNKLAALYLMTSQGVTMIHAGQEFARSKVIQKTDVPDTNWGYIDHNSYEKDNNTNYINYDHVEINAELFDYYKNLIHLRKNHPAFRQSEITDITFIPCDNEFGIGYILEGKSSGDTNDFIVLLNGNSNKDANFNIPEGQWEILVDQKRVYFTQRTTFIENSVSVPPTSGLVLTKKRHD